MPNDSSVQTVASTEWIRTESDYDLIEMITWSDTEREISSVACSELYKRHAPYLLALWHKRQGSPSSVDPEDIVQETFIRLFEGGARSFKRGEGQDPDCARKHVRMWLGKMSQYIVIDLYRQQKISVVQVDQEALESFPEIRHSSLEKSSQAIMDAYNTLLNEREKEVLRVVSLYFDWRKPNQKIPSEALDELASAMGITRENFRQIKKRAIAKIQKSGLSDMFV